MAVYVINKMATSEECAKSSSNISKQSSRQRLSLETSLENLKKLSSSLEPKKTPKRSNFFLSYDSSGKRTRSEYKYRSVAERTTHKKHAVSGLTMSVTGKRQFICIHLLFVLHQ